MSQTTFWAEHGSNEWGQIFERAFSQRTDFSRTADALPIPTTVPMFDRFLEGKVSGSMLRASGVSKWGLSSSLAGLVRPSATTLYDCVLGLTTTTKTNLNNDYPQYPVDARTFSSKDQTSSPSTSAISDASSESLDEPNYLTVLTLAWTYVLSTY